MLCLSNNGFQRPKHNSQSNLYWNRSMYTRYCCSEPNIATPRSYFKILVPFRKTINCSKLFLQVQATQPLFQRQRNADKALFLFVLKARAIRAFLLTWSASMQIYWNKRKRLHKKRVRIPRDWFGTPIWPPWRHVKILYPFDLGKMIQWLYLRVRIRIADRFTVTMSWCRTVASCVALTVPVAMMMMMWSKTA